MIRNYLFFNLEVVSNKKANSRCFDGNSRFGWKI